MRDVILSGLAGFLTACTGGFLIHRAIWKTADQHAEAIEALSPHHRKQIIQAQPVTNESFETQIARKAANWWNKGVDNVHDRLLKLPSTMKMIVNDVSKSKSTEEESE